MTEKKVLDQARQAFDIGLMVHIEANVPAWPLVAPPAGGLPTATLHTAQDGSLRPVRIG